MQLRILQVTQVCIRAGLDEEGIVAPPEHECGRAVPVQPSLPLGVLRDVIVIVEQQIDLDRLATGLVEKVLVQRPPIGCDARDVVRPALVLAAGHFQRQQRLRVLDSAPGTPGRRATKVLAISLSPS